MAVVCIMVHRKKFLLIAATACGLLSVSAAVFAIDSNQIAAQVQVVCPVGDDMWSSGSGTIIDSKGVILTNKHVVGNSSVCVIGLLSSVNKEPSFYTNGKQNLAVVRFTTHTADMDAAVLYLVNTDNRKLPSVDIWNSNSDLLRFGDKIEVIGYPKIGGSSLTYTSGDFSGFGVRIDGTHNYIKSTATLEHGNSGGAAYTAAGKFIGIPTMVVSGELNSLGYILSVNSIKNWLRQILGSDYRQDVIQEKPQTPIETVSIQDDITPPSLKKFAVGIVEYNRDKEEKSFAYRYDNNKIAYYEFPFIEFGWRHNCAQEDCINDDSGSIAGYYYYFGSDKTAIPASQGQYIAANALAKDKFFNEENSSVKLPILFEAQKGSNYFILQARDNKGNTSNALMNLEYIYEPDSFKDIRGIRVKDAHNRSLGYLHFPSLSESAWCQAVSYCKERRLLDYTAKLIQTNQDTLVLYPDYGYKIDGIVYYISYNDDRWWMDKIRKGVVGAKPYIVISNIKKRKKVNLFLKPDKASINGFLSKHLILEIEYNAKKGEKLSVPVSDLPESVKIQK